LENRIMNLCLSLWDWVWLYSEMKSSILQEKKLSMDNE
jgi:hypothetical protein